MDREILVEQLALAQVHVADDELLITQQKHLIGKLNRDGHATGGAEEFLHALEIVQALHVARRERLKRELATSKLEWTYLPADRRRRPRLPK